MTARWGNPGFTSSVLKRGRWLGPILAVVAVAATLAGPVSPAAAAATSVQLSGVNSSVNLDTPDDFTVTLRDGNGVVDTAYTGTVTFTAGAGCVSTCFLVLEGNNTPLPSGVKTYTFVGGDAGVKAFRVIWTASAVGARTFRVSATLTAGGPTIDEESVTVVDPAATTTTSTTTSSTSSTSSTTSTTSTTLPPRGPGSIEAVRPEGGVTGSPDAAAIRGVERVDVVVNRDSTVNWTFQAAFGAWQPYSDLGAPPGGMTGDPSITSWAPGRLDVFVRGADNKLWHRYSQNSGSTWSTWYKPLGDDGTLASGPAVSSRAPDRLDIFVVGTDGIIYERFWDKTYWNHAWLPHGKPGVGITGDPTSVSWDVDRIDVFVRGTDNKLWQRSLSNFTWSAWGKPVGDAGTLTSSPDAASWAKGVLLVFARGSDGRGYVLPYGGAWGGWIALAATTDVLKEGSHPGATSRGLDRFDMFHRGTDDRTYHVWQ